jgi:hypothetical protein
MAAGETGIPPQKLLAFREHLASIGYELPPISEGPPRYTSSAPSTVKRPRGRHGRIRIGDRIAGALALVGVTESRIERWLGGCGCGNRRKKLNRLSDWAESVTAETAAAAKQKLQGLLQ